MVRNYKRHSTSRNSYDAETISKAVEEVRNSEYSIRTVAAKYNVKASALSYHVGRTKNQETAKDAGKALCQSQTRNQIFFASLEEKLKDYILMSADLYVGVDPQNIRVLAYDLTLANKL